MPLVGGLTTVRRLHGESLLSFMIKLRCSTTVVCIRLYLPRSRIRHCHLRDSQLTCTHPLAFRTTSGNRLKRSDSHYPIWRLGDRWPWRGRRPGRRWRFWRAFCMEDCLCFFFNYKSWSERLLLNGLEGPN